MDGGDGGEEEFVFHLLLRSRVRCAIHGPDASD